MNRAVGWLLAAGAWGAHLALYPACLGFAVATAPAARAFHTSLDTMGDQLDDANWRRS